MTEISKVSEQTHQIMILQLRKYIFLNVMLKYLMSVLSIVMLLIVLVDSQSDPFEPGIVTVHHHLQLGLPSCTTKFQYFNNRRAQ